MKSSTDPCDIQVDIDFVTPTEIEIEVTNASEPIKYFVTDGENKTVSEGKKRVKNLSKGKYKYFIHDSQGCWAKGDFEVK